MFVNGPQRVRKAAESTHFVKTKQKSSNLTENNCDTLLNRISCHIRVSRDEICGFHLLDTRHSVKSVLQEAQGSEPATEWENKAKERNDDQ